MCVTDCHDITLAVRVALNCNTTNQENFACALLTFLSYMLFIYLFFISRFREGKQKHVREENLSIKHKKKFSALVRCGKLEPMETPDTDSDVKVPTESPENQTDLLKSNTSEILQAPDIAIRAGNLKQDIRQNSTSLTNSAGKGKSVVSLNYSKNREYSDLDIKDENREINIPSSQTPLTVNNIHNVGELHNIDIQSHVNNSNNNIIANRNNNHNGEHYHKEEHNINQKVKEP